MTGIVSGLAIGAIGVGGVAIVPLLVGLTDLKVASAIATAEFGYVVTGLVGYSVHVRSGAVSRSDAVALMLTAAPGAAAGALVASRLPPPLLELALSALMIASGSAALVVHRAPRGGEDEPMPVPMLAVCGFVTGGLSALTGTGGPAVMLPLLTFMEARSALALALAQVVQVPIAGAATLANVVQGSVPWSRAATLAAALALGSWCGTRLARGLDPERLRRWICLALVVVGAALALEQAIALVR